MPDKPLSLREGDRVEMICDGQKVAATVRLASPNFLSLFVEFEAILYGCVGQMPLMFQDRRYVCIANGEEVRLRKVQDGETA